MSFIEWKDKVDEQLETLLTSELKFDTHLLDEVKKDITTLKREITKLKNKVKALQG
jgi:polyhydroxyalkanoate synthesis regulator phasin